MPHTMARLLELLPCGEGRAILPNSQRAPSRPGLQMHRYPATRSWQEPPCRHGWDWHSSISGREAHPGCKRQERPENKAMLPLLEAVA